MGTSYAGLFGMRTAFVEVDYPKSTQLFGVCFKSVIGVSPKVFAKIFRFNYALQCMRIYPNKDLPAIAIECGYYDHTHLAKDFKSLTGDTPSDFRQTKSTFYTYGEECNV